VHDLRFFKSKEIDTEDEDQGTSVFKALDTELKEGVLGIIFVHFVAKYCIGLFSLSSND